jgi:hypothetical protein
MGEDNVDVWLLETLEGALESFTDVLLGKTACVGFLAGNVSSATGHWK